MLPALWRKPVRVRKFECEMLPGSLSRRELLAGLAAAGFAGVPRAFHAAPARGSGRFTQWGLQLYTVRNLLQEDFPGTLKAVASIGYREVETHNYFRRTPAEVRRILDDAGLAAPSAHVGLDQVRDNLPELLEACRAIGHRWLVVPSLPGSVRGNADAYRRVGETLATAAERAKPAGVRIAFHNHDAEFAPLGDTNGMELLLAAAPADTLFVELDVYWIVRAGDDPFAFLERHGSRVKMLHVKDSGGPPEHRMRDVGAGTIEWGRLLSLAQRHGVEHAFVEHDNPGDALASIRASYGYLARLGIPRSGE